MKQSQALISAPLRRFPCCRRWSAPFQPMLEDVLYEVLPVIGFAICASSVLVLVVMRRAADAFQFTVWFAAIGWFLRPPAPQQRLPLLLPILSLVRRRIGHAAEQVKALPQYSRTSAGEFPVRAGCGQFRHRWATSWRSLHAHRPAPL